MPLVATQQAPRWGTRLPLPEMTEPLPQPHTPFLASGKPLPQARAASRFLFALEVLGAFSSRAAPHSGVSFCTCCFFFFCNQPSPAPTTASGGEQASCRPESSPPPLSGLSPPSIFPSADQENTTALIPATHNTGGSLPDLTNIHFPSPLPTPLDPEEPTFPALSSSSSTGNLAANLTHLGIGAAGQGKPGRVGGAPLPCVRV